MNTTARERPILFSAPMVRAILDGNKTQTRRLVNVQPFEGCLIRYCAGDLAARGLGGNRWVDVRVPLGAPGDRLWVRESFWEAGDYHSVGDSGDCFAWHGGRRYFFASDGSPPNEPNRDYPQGLRNGAYSAAEPNSIWRRFPSIHMPREASRITLEITAVRVERVQSISEADAIAEGIRPWYSDGPKPSSYMLGPDDREKPFYDGRTGWHPSATAVDAYRRLWERINGDASWRSNPWVWVIEFKRV